MLPVRTGYHDVWLFGEESACATGCWALDCSEIVTVNISRIVYRESAHIVLGRWIDAEDHMHIENLAASKKQCPPFRQCLGGDAPLWVLRPI